MNAPPIPGAGPTAIDTPVAERRAAAKVLRVAALVPGLLGAVSGGIIVLGGRRWAFVALTCFVVGSVVSLILRKWLGRSGLSKTETADTMYPVEKLLTSVNKPIDRQALLAFGAIFAVALVVAVWKVATQ
jgi:hypothetical protein